MTSGSIRRVRPAGFVSRFIAFIIDLVIISVTSTIAIAGFNEVIAFFGIDILFGRWVGNFAPGQLVSTVIRVLAVLAYYIISILYFAIFWSLVDYTPGKYLLGLRVVRIDGRDLGFWRSALRAVCYYLSAILLFMGFIWIIFDKKRQGLHDKIAGTVVIYS